MSANLFSPRTILRRKQVQAQTGSSRSTIYARIAQGLWPRPIAIGPRSVGWLASEVAALIDARVAGLHDDEIRLLVKNLEAARQTAVCREVEHV